jgi:hypothetical protein
MSGSFNESGASGRGDMVSDLPIDVNIDYIPVRSCIATYRSKKRGCLDCLPNISDPIHNETIGNYFPSSDEWI